MIQENKLTTTALGYPVSLDIYPVGDDILAVLKGGIRPHIGCTVLAVPRQSLTGDGSMSCTSSVINVTGHKDEAICRRVAEALSRTYACTVICTGGVHFDGAGPQDIKDIQDAVEALIRDSHLNN